MPRCLITRCLTFLLCWVVLLAWVFHRAKERSRRDFIRTPEGIRDLNYPAWLLRAARRQHLSSKRVLFIGDSVVNGWKATSEKTTISARLAQGLAAYRMQTFTFALMGIGPRDYQRICRENLRDDDYAIVQLLPLDERLSQGTILAPGAYGPPRGWRTPFLLLRGEVASCYEKAPSFLLFDGAHYLKEMLRQKSFRPLMPKNYKLFTPQNPTINNIKDLNNLELFKAPFSARAREGIEELLTLLQPQRKRTLVYITPLNPYYLDDRGLRGNAGFRANIEWIKALCKKRGFACLDYALDQRALEMSDFIDYAHYTDEAAGKMGNILTADFVRFALAP